MKSLKSYLPKETLLDTAILLVSILSIKKGLLCWGNLYFSISVSSNFKLHNFYIRFFYNFFNF